MRARGQLDEQAIACSVDTGVQLAVAGLHPATGGDGSLLCSGDMLLQALVACAGSRCAPSPPRWTSGWPVGPSPPRVTWTSAAPWPLTKQVPVGFSAIRLAFDLDIDATAEQLQT